MKKTKILALILAVLMVVGMLPISAFATSVNALSSDEPFATPQLTVATEKNSTLAPGITQDAYTLYNNKDEQVKMFVTTADMSVDTVKLFASYKDMDPTNYGMSKLTEQVASFNEKAAAGDEYYQGTVVAGINASYYNMITGKPTGTFVMNGIDVTTESEGNAYGYFAVMKDGSVKIGNKNDYSKDKGNIQEAIGIYTMLIVDGKICSGLDKSKYYPRQTIGITADGKVVLMTADGNQAPKSIGLTVQEQAEVMLDLGCVWAGHLDGGGSCTYAAKAEGSSEFKIENSPSDGSERSISNGFIMVSTAVSDGKFYSASLTPEYEYVTPGSTVAISTIGVDKAGGPAEIPANAVLTATNGTIVDGKFVSDGTVGEAVVSMLVDGVEVGSTVINVVIPTEMSFNSSEMVVPFGKSVPLNINATYGAKDVILKASDVKFELSNTTIGTVEGFEFFAGAEGEAATESTLKATFVYDATLTATTNIKLGKGSEVVYDFEDGTNQNVYIDETPGTKYNYVFPESDQFVATAENGKVHNGSYAIGSNINYGNSLESGYMKTSLYTTETKVFENAVGIGAWIYIPDEFVGLWARWRLRTATVAEDGTVTWVGSFTSNAMDNGAGGTGVVYTFKESGWHYLYADATKYSAVGWRANEAIMEFYISDRDGADYNYVAAENSNIPGKYTIYLDDITVDYSSAVEDREAPILSNVTYATEGMADAAALNGNTITTNKVTLAASVAEDTTKSNFTGLDESSIKAYVDGVEYVASYSNGKVSIDDITLDNGKHTVKFSAYDKMGNYGYVYQTINVNAAETNSTVKLVPTDATLKYPKLGSIYNMDLVATAIEEVDSVEVVIDLDNNSTWQLAHMDVADGFEASYEVEPTENIATITITRVGKNTQTGEAALATLPVRIWTLKTGYVYQNGTKQGTNAYTLAQFKSMKEFWRMSVIANVDKGFLTRVDNTVSTFSGERVFCDTEMWGNYAKMSSTTAGLEYYNSWDGGHLHSAAAIDDKDATCTKAGYKNRTFCEVCNSVVDWGTTIPATGHTFVVKNGVVKCSCGELFNGVYTDGKTYVDGVVIANGWNGESYYLDGVMLYGLQEIDGYYYDFGTEGVCVNKAKLDGFFFDTKANAYRYFTAGKLTTGEVNIFPEIYFFDANGLAVSGDVDLLGYTCYFNEQGAFVSSTNENVVDAGFCGTNIKYVLLADGTLYVGGEGAMKDYTNNGIYPAWVIKNDMEAVKSIVIGKDITSIGRYGFYRNGYAHTITFEEGSSLKTVGYGAFSKNWRLTGITFPASVEVLEDYAVYSCGALKYIDFEEGSKLHTIGFRAFSDDHGLDTVFIPDTVTNIGNLVFEKASTDVVLNVVKDSYAYYYAINNGMAYETREGVVYPVQSGTVNENITWEIYPDGTLYVNGKGAIPNFTNQNAQPWANYRNLVKSIVIDKDITVIGNYSFAYMTSATSVVFEEGSVLETIGSLAFRNCAKVTEIVLPNSVELINGYAFDDCYELVNFYMSQNVNHIKDTAFGDCAKMVMSVADGTYGVEFAKANNLNYVVRDFEYIPLAGGTCGANIEWNFYGNGELRLTGSGDMTNLTSHTQQPWASYRHLIEKIVIGSDITFIADYAFAYTPNVTEIVFEEGSALTTIGSLAFRNCAKVKTITLPNSVEMIKGYAFDDCYELENFYMSQNVNHIKNTAFGDCTKMVMSVAKGTYGEEFAKSSNLNYAVRAFEYIPLVGGTCGANIEWNFYGNGELWLTGSGDMTNLTSHTQQPWAAYRHLIEKIVIDKDITFIADYAFAYTPNVTEIEFEEGSVLTTVGSLAFRNCAKVKTITLPNSVEMIKGYAFDDCYELENFYMSQNVNHIKNTAFGDCTKMVMSVAKGTYGEEFAKSSNLNYEVRDFEYIPLAGGNYSENIEWNFYGNGELWITGTGVMANLTSHTQQPWAAYRHLIEKIVIGKDITTIADYAFAYTANVTEIEFEEGSVLNTIGGLSFRNCAKLESVVLPESVQIIKTLAFDDCYALESLYVPAGMVNIKNNAFGDCSELVMIVVSGSYGESFAIANNIDYEIIN